MSTVLRRVLYLVIASTPACFVEGAVGVTPKLSQQLTDFSGAVTTSSHSAVTFSLWLGFHLDVNGVGVAYSPKVGYDAATAPAHTPSVATSGQHLRLDVDLPFHRGLFNLRATAAYSTVGSAEVDARGAMTPTSTPGLPNGKTSATDVSGGTFFAGVSMAAYEQTIGGALTASLGTTYRSITSGGREDFASGSTIPGISQSGVGLELRVMVQWQVQWRYFRYVPKIDFKPEIDPRFLPKSDPKPDPIKCVNQYGSPIPC